MESKPKEIFWLLVILLLAGVFRFWGLPGLELHNDAGHYAFRALGWFDYLGSSEQTAPLQWFGRIPAWANLSFHDAPPLAFLLQKISFGLLGGSVFAALLPAALAGLAAFLFVYFAVKTVFGAPWARVAALFYAISSYAIWSGRVGYLEAVEVAFLAGSFFCFLKYWTNSETKYLYWWGAFTGLALITKYTALFLLPPVVALVLWKRRELLKKPDFWMAVFLLFVVLTPVIVYNVMVFSTRGHLDAALSSMVGMRPDDFKLIANRAVDANWWQNASGVFQVLAVNISQPMFWLYLAGLLWLGVSVVRRRASDFAIFLFLNAVGMWLLFGFSGSADRYLSIAMPFLIMALVLAVWDVWQKAYAQFWRRAIIAVLAIATAVEMVFSAQTNLLVKPVWESNRLYSAGRFYNRGFAQVDKFLQANLKIAEKPLVRPESTREISGLTLADPVVVFFDTRADWFATMWHVSRFRFYYNAPIVNFRPAWPDARGKLVDTYEQFRRFGIPEMLLLVAVGESKAYSGGETYETAMESLLARVKAAGIAPVKVINDYQGKPGFEIYRLKPTDLK